MNTQQERSFLSKIELRERLIAFAHSDGSLDSAADLGLLALYIPPRFGGLFVRVERLNQILQSLYWLRTGEKLRIPQLHGRVCSQILSYGTFAQYDLYLPRLAAGKRIGILAYLNYMSTSVNPSLNAIECDDGFSLTGNTVARGSVDNRSFVSLTAMLEGQARSFIVEGAALPQGRKVKRGWTLYELRRHFIAQHTLLGGLMPVVQPSTEKWEAIRWRTDQSAS